MNSPQAAIKDFEKAITLRENDYASFNGLGLEFERIGETQKAQEWWSQAVEILSRQIENADSTKCNAQLYFWRGMILSNAKHIKEGMEDYKRAIEMNPTMSDVYYYRARAHVNLRNYERAIEDNSRSIEINPNFAPNFADRAYSYRALKNIPAAEADEKRYKELSGVKSESKTEETKP
jgi:tetratricopeptide (TPR) repeat protein